MIVLEIAAGIILSVIILANFELVLGFAWLALLYSFLYVPPIIAGVAVLATPNKDSDFAFSCAWVVVIWVAGLIWYHRPREKS
jgi:hypothetical protein